MGWLSGSSNSGEDVTPEGNPNVVISRDIPWWEKPQSDAECYLGDED